MSPVYADVRGAPFKIGERVRVCRIVDEEGETATLGKQGVVEYFEYSCGCGQSYPRDPMIGVRFSDESLHEFCHEELRRILWGARNRRVRTDKMIAAGSHKRAEDMKPQRLKPTFKNRSIGMPKGMP